MNYVSAMLNARASLARPPGKSNRRRELPLARWSLVTRGDRERSRVGILTSVRLARATVLTEAKSNSEAGVVSADGSWNPSRRRRGSQLVSSCRIVRAQGATKPLKEDDLPEASIFSPWTPEGQASARGQWDDARWRTGVAAEKVGEGVPHWGKKWDNLVDSDAVKDAAPLVTGAVNVAIATCLASGARVAALQAVGGPTSCRVFQPAAG